MSSLPTLCFLSPTSNGCPFILSPNIPSNAWWLFGGLQQSYQDAQISRYFFDSYVSPKVKKTLASSMRSGLCHTRLNALDFFQDTSFEDRRICAPLEITGPKDYSWFCGPCIGASENGKLSAPQKELLKWHWKLGIAMYRIHEMMRERHYLEPNGNKRLFFLP